MDWLRRILLNKVILSSTVILIGLAIPLVVSLPVVANASLNGQTLNNLGYGYGSGSTGTNWTLIGGITAGVIVVGIVIFTLVRFFRKPK